MHFALILDIKANPERRKEIDAYIWDQILNSYKRARRLSGNLIIVEINSDEDWKVILSKLTDYIKGQTETIHFVMTPALTGGRYNGILPKDQWDYINQITG